MRKTIWLLLCLFPLAVIAGNKNSKEVAVRGIWVPDPSHTNVLHSYKNVCDFVAQVDEVNLNTIFLASYAKTQTIYKSQVLTDYSTYGTPEEGCMLTPYMVSYNTPLKSPTGDPVKDLITEAHKRGIKVFFWFEYGFMGDIKPIPDNNPLLAKNPTWLGTGNDGQPANYHGKDFYFNAYDPAIQEYMIKLVEESIDLYPQIDGVQGDDRLPAMARNSGYDKLTVDLYKSQHNGAEPPHDFDDAAWVRWRLDLLNGFGQRFYDRVKAKNKNVLVSFSPNPYPWCEEKLMQEWPVWVKLGICDLLAVQCYRYDETAYKNTTATALKYARESNENQLFAPGIILMEGGSIKMNADLLKKQVAANRALGINGEIYFYNSALNDAGIKETLKELYPNKVKFPKVVKAKK